MKPPRAVVFDLGKVLLDFDYGRAAQSLAQRSKLDVAETARLLNQSPLLHRFETGLMKGREFFDEVRAATGYRGDVAEFAAEFGDIFSPIPPMIELHGELRRRGVLTFIFSNTNEFAIGHIRRQYPFFANFDGYIFSYEHGAMKPEAKIYAVVEQVTGCRGAEIFYLDDREENVAPALRLDWRAIVYTSPEQARAAVIKVGLLDHA